MRLIAASTASWNIVSGASFFVAAWFGFSVDVMVIKWFVLFGFGCWPEGGDQSIGSRVHIKSVICMHKESPSHAR